MRVQELLDEKGREVCTLPGDRTVEDAINLMTDKKISAVMIMEEEHPIGIFTERDVIRCHVRYREKPFAEIKLNEVMTNKLIVAELQDEIRAAMSMMIRMDIRHLPVVKEGKIIGMLSIRDLVQRQVESLTAELHYLQEYISDLQDAGRD